MDFSTPDIYDQFFDSIKILALDLKKYGAREKFCGEIVTIKCFEDNSKVGEMLQQNGKDKILLVDGGASPHRALLGDNLAKKAMENGWNGIIVNGRIRDVEIINSFNLGVLALGAHPAKTEKKGAGEVNIPLHLGGIDILPGQFIYADLNGVIVAPRRIDLSN